jgi:methyl-accepting chemotaxis protein
VPVSAESRIGLVHGDQVKKLRIKTTIRLAIAVLGASYLALLLLVQWTGARTQTHMDLASGSLFPASLRSQDAAAAFQRFTKAYSDAVVIDDAAAFSKADDPARSVIEALSSIQQHSDGFSPERQKQVSVLLNQFKDLQRRSQNVYSEVVAANGNASDQSWAAVADLGKDNKRVETALQELITALSSDFQAQLDSVTLWSRVQRIFGWALFLLVAASVVLIMRTMERRVSIPLQQLTIRFKDIAGDLTGAEEGSASSDEIGELDHSFSAMVSHLQNMAAITSGIADGDLSQEIHPRSEHDALGKALQQMADGLSALVLTVRDSARQVDSGAAQVAEAAEASAKVGVQASGAIDTVSGTMHEMNVNVQSVVKGMQMQAGDVRETSASIHQMVVSIQRVADATSNLLDISARSRREAEDGIVSMDKATDGLNRINTSIQSSAEIIGTLGQRVKDIGKIVDVIDNLAEQTNLLALNAAIEAARAGEHGLGFAVVADEVRKLSEKSAQSTKEISELIQNIQKEAHKAVGNMDQSIAIVDEGLALGANLSGSLTRISRVVEEVYKFAEEIRIATKEQADSSSQIGNASNRLNEITSEISCAVTQQAAGTDAVVSSMEHMRELVQQSSSSSVELAAQSEQMSTMSRKLLEVMDRFKLRSESPLRLETHRKSQTALWGPARK